MSEPFPSIDEDTPSTATAQDAATPTTPGEGTPSVARREAHSDASTLSSRVRSASKRFNESNPPSGFMAATGQTASSMPSTTDLRRGTFNSEGWSGEGQIVERERRASLARSGKAQPPAFLRRQSPGTTTQQASEPIHERETGDSAENAGIGDRRSNTSSHAATEKPVPVDLTEPYPNGYQFPPKHNWKQSSVMFLKASVKFVTAPLGFLITLYGLNVVAWGGMLFLLLCNASPAMCHPSCGDINSPRRKWIEIDSQILNALFCVTGFGLIPWRFRDFYHLMNYRINKTQEGLTRLAGIHRDWFRLEGSRDLPVNIGSSNIEQVIATVPLSSIPYPPKSIPDAPLTGIRAPPTPLWKLDFVIWAFVVNTALQAVLSGFMWGFNRYDRPSWSTGLFVALACLVSAAGGYVIFIEGKRVKGIEGVPVSEQDKERLKSDRELGIVQFNNINDSAPKQPKEKKAKVGQNTALGNGNGVSGHEVEGAGLGEDEIREH